MGESGNESKKSSEQSFGEGFDKPKLVLSSLYGVFGETNYLEFLNERNLKHTSEK